jgi:putative DNA primase/helicase
VSLEQIAAANHGKKSGRGYLIRCPNPAHKDVTPSCHLESGHDGQILVHCFAGCDQSSVIEGLRSQGLWPATQGAQARPRRSNKTIEVIYGYTDERGELLYEVVRYRPKAFVQRYPDGRGGWMWKKHPRQVLFHLPEVLESAIVFVVEGEKDVQTLRDRGFSATTNAGGAMAPWLPAFTDSLRGREVIIVPDNDKPGWDRAAVIARCLHGHAARIRVLDLPREVKDISDWFATGHSECGLIAMLEGGVHAA